MPKLLHGFQTGDRVRHTGWDHLGTVRVFEDAAPDEAAGEVAWDGTCVADELDEHLAAKLQII